MGFTSKQLKALQWYIDGNKDLRLQLSQPPAVYFKNSKNQIVAQSISTISYEYDAWNEEDKKQRARERRQNAVQ